MTRSTKLKVKPRRSTSIEFITELTEERQNG